MKGGGIRKKTASRFDRKAVFFQAGGHCKEEPSLALQVRTDPIFSEQDASHPQPFPGCQKDPFTSRLFSSFHLPEGELLSLFQQAAKKESEGETNTPSLEERQRERGYGRRLNVSYSAGERLISELKGLNLPPPQPIFYCATKAELPLEPPECFEPTGRQESQEIMVRLMAAS